MLFKTVKKCMIHGPCGAENSNAPCMVDDGWGGKICLKGFPKAFQEFTMMDHHGYLLYFWPNDGRAFEVNGRMVDNHWIVPFPPFLCTEFDCHINMECAVTLGTFKYAFKYIHKGPDRGALEVRQKDEVKCWIDGRYISPPDAVWHLLHFITHEQVPNVVRLQVHLENHHVVTFNPNHDLHTILQ